MKEIRKVTGVFGASTNDKVVEKAHEKISKL